MAHFWLVRKFCRVIKYLTLLTSVHDQDPDPYVLRLPGSVSGIYLYKSGSFNQQAKK
jgi:hypothetical protein